MPARFKPGRAGTMWLPMAALDAGGSRLLSAQKRYRSSPEIPYTDTADNVFLKQTAGLRLEPRRQHASQLRIACREI